MGQAVGDERQSAPIGRTVRRGAWLVLAALLLGLGLLILWQFIPALIWAVILALATWPLYERMAAPRGAKGSLTALAFTLLVTLVFAVPLVLLAIEAAREAIALVHWAEVMEREGAPPPAWVATLPLLGGYVADWWQTNLTDPHSLRDILGRVNQRTLVEWTGTVGGQVARRIIVLLFTLLTLFFLYRDGAVLGARLESLALRIFGPAGPRLGGNLVAAVRGTVNGLVLVGLAEGLLLGIAYAVVGLPHAALLGALTGVLAMIPFGAPVIFAIGALVLLMQHELGAAIFIFAFGMVIVFVADHFVRPALIGGAARLPFLWVLLGILGGLQAFGLLGLFLGPAVMAALIALWREWTVP